jgi:prepilin peptidase CpaA
MVVAVVVDIRSRRIPNTLTATMAGLGIGFAAAGVSGVSLIGSIVGLVLGFGLMLPGHVLGATGAGDVKLMAAAGALVGPAVVIKAFLFTAVAGGVLALAVAVRRNRVSATLATTAQLLAAPAGARKQIQSAPSANRFAYGPAIAIGSVLAVLLG